MSWTLVAAVALPALAGLLGSVGGSHRGVTTRSTVVLTALSLAAALVAAAAVAVDGPLSVVVERSDGSALVGLHADRVGVVLLCLICGVSTVVQGFAGRYLRGDPRARRFHAVAALMTAATAATAIAATLVGLAVAWTLSGVALCVLLNLYRELPAARDGVRRTVRAFAIGDGALWVAVAVAVATWGDLDLRSLGEEAPALASDDVALVTVACLLVVAAIARSAQLPLQGWLPATLAAPTPVSALLHAGVVNAGGVLLVRLSPVFGASTAATHLAFAAGAATAVYGTALMLVKPDIKGALAHSTMGQMGFMIMTCGLGAFAAAIFHLAAHGMYKATLFLGSGSAVHRHVRHRRAPPIAALGRAHTVAAAAGALLVSGVVLGASVLLLYGEAAGSTTALLLFAWATVAWASFGWLLRQPSLAGALTVVGAIVLAVPLYVWLLDAFSAFLAPALAGAGTQTASPWLLMIPGAALLLASLARLGPRSRLASLHEALYVAALGAGDAGARGRRRWARRVARPAAPAPALTSQTSGGVA